MADIFPSVGYPVRFGPDLDPTSKDRPDPVQFRIRSKIVSGSIFSYSQIN
jgi:hypothetical protein